MRKKTRKTKPFFSLDEHDITILQNHQYFLKYQILLFIYYYSCYYFFVTISYHCILLLLGYYFHITTLCILLQPVLLFFLGFSKIKIVTPFQKITINYSNPPPSEGGRGNGVVKLTLNISRLGAGLQMASRTPPVGSCLPPGTFMKILNGTADWERP